MRTTGNLDILLIEDNIADQTILRTHLEEYNSELTIEAKSSLVEAFDWLSSNRVDFVFLDLNLPESNGLDSLSKLLNQFPSLCVIILTGNRDVDIASKAIDMGAKDFLLKSKIDGDRINRTLLYNLERKKKEEFLKKRNKDLEQFAYIATHDLKSPLGNITQVIALFKEDLENPDEYFEMLSSCLKSMNETIAGLTDVMVLKSKIRSAEKDKVDLVELLESILNDHSQLIKTNGIVIEKAFEPSIKLSYNKAHLKSILQNLLSNAIKYGNPETPKIKLSIYHEGSQLCFQIEDNGLGMDLKKKGKNLFKMFNRFHSHTNIEGKGIGLNMINSIVEENGGEIEVESEVNVGTKFKVIFNGK